MLGFSSCDAYRDFAWSVSHQSRYVFEQAVEEFLKAVVDTGQKRKNIVEPGGLLYRAQLGFDLEDELIDPDSPESGTYQVPGPFSRERMKPLPNSAREGRVNPKGIPCLYLSDDPNTAMAETRPWLDSYISLGCFRVSRRLQLMDCSKPKQFMGLALETQFSTDEIEEAVWGEIAYAFSEPVTPSDITAEYAATQVLSEVFRGLGCDGIRYKSLLGQGHSFALFDLEAARLIGCGLHQTASVRFQFAQAGNPYVISEE